MLYRVIVYLSEYSKLGKAFYVIYIVHILIINI